MEYTVYKIEYKGEVKYVGKTCDFERRKWRHLNGYGAIPTDVDLNEVEIMPIETYTEETDALKREDELILHYDTINNGWNRQRSGLVKVSDVKAYQREWHREYSKTDIYKAKKREWEKKRRQTEKCKQYMQKYCEEHREEKRDYDKKRSNTPEHKEYRREYMRQYRERKKQLKQKQV